MASRIRDAKELRVKESDRIALVAKNLPWAPWERSSPSTKTASTSPATSTCTAPLIDSGSDHRIAMAFSIAALRADGDTEIHGAEAAAISFPEFFTHLDQGRSGSKLAQALPDARRPVRRGSPATGWLRLGNPVR
jgi:3-phosphoshikimate 1-carboxyvinyltransferase